MYPLALLIGGRNQNTHSLRSRYRWFLSTGGAAGVAPVAATAPGAAAARAVATDDFSPAAPAAPTAGAEVTDDADLKPTSKGFPGDLGVLAEVPKLENAPEPRPKALDAGPPGLMMRLPPGVVTALNGFDFPPCDELSPPNRLGRVVVLRVEEGEAAGASPKLPIFGLVLVERESLLELEEKVVSKAHTGEGYLMSTATHLVRRP